MSYKSFSLCSTKTEQRSCLSLTALLIPHEFLFACCPLLSGKFIASDTLMFSIRSSRDLSP